MNKKGFALPILIALIIFSLILIFVEWNPFGKLSNIKSQLNYFLFFGIFIFVQIVIIFCYYKLGKYLSLAFRWYNFKLKKIAENIHRKLNQSQLT